MFYLVFYKSLFSVTLGAFLEFILFMFTVFSCIFC